MTDAARPFLANRDARRLFLARHGLSQPFGAPLSAANLHELIQEIGFVQVDSVNTVARAHDMILAARNANYRPRQLKALLEKRRSLFEHWTHDAAIIPMAFYPHWRLRFERDAVRLRDRWRDWRRDGFEDRFEAVLAHIRERGPAMARDVGGDEDRSSGGWWDWHPSKTALEFLWRTGALAVSGREGFQKIFDLEENVVPADIRAHRPNGDATVAWACESALDRLGFGTSGEIAAFWATVAPSEAKAWAARALGDSVIEVDVEGADGGVRRAFARPDVLAAVAASRPPLGRLRVLSPFDPALRDRRRAEWLFGFRYRIEIFVPAPKRTYGYYVFPVLEGDRLVGRIDMKRDEGALAVTAYWPEPGLTLGRARALKLERELDRLAVFAGCDRVRFADGWLRQPL